MGFVEEEDFSHVPVEPGPNYGPINVGSAGSNLSIWRAPRYPTPLEMAERMTSPDVVSDITQPITDFGSFLSPDGKTNWWRVGVIIGGIFILGYTAGVFDKTPFMKGHAWGPKGYRRSKM